MNVNAGHKGREVITLPTMRSRRFGDDFPGWGAPDAAKYLIEAEADLVGTVYAVESHGANPWTRYSVRFEDGTRSYGLVPGIDFEWVN